jgi:hypothetical protein
MCLQVLVEGKFWKKVENAAKKVGKAAEKVAQEVGPQVVSNVILDTLKG